MAHSATSAASSSGVWQTAMPRRRAAARSMRSRPAPLQAISCRSGSRSISAASAPCTPIVKAMSNPGASSTRRERRLAGIGQPVALRQRRAQIGRDRTDRDQPRRLAARHRHPLLAGRNGRPAPKTSILVAACGRDDAMAYWTAGIWRSGSGDHLRSGKGDLGAALRGRAEEDPGGHQGRAARRPRGRAQRGRTPHPGDDAQQRACGRDLQPPRLLRCRHPGLFRQDRHRARGSTATSSRRSPTASTIWSRPSTRRSSSTSPIR